MIKKILNKIFASIFYPTNRNDWFRSKGYLGSSPEARFQDFLVKQKIEGAHFYLEFMALEITRQFIPSDYGSLDSVIMTPEKIHAKNHPGYGLFFIMFQGRGEYYEGRFREMAIHAKATGSSVLGFNPKGFHSSSGTTKTLNDLVQDGISVVNYLLAKGVSHRKIILQGNSLGASVAEMVYEHFRKNHNIRFHQINGNSLRSLGAVLSCSYRLPFMDKIVSKFLKFSGWEIIPGPRFYLLSPYRCHLRRRGDRTVLPEAQYHAIVNYQKSYEKAPSYYKPTLKWLYENSLLTYVESSRVDPHRLSLYEFQIPELDENGAHQSVYRWINRYLEAVFKKRHKKLASAVNDNIETLKS